MSALPARVTVVETRPAPRREEVKFVYSSSYLIGFIIAIVIIVLAIIIILWLVRVGLVIASEVLADGSRRGFPASYAIGIILAIIILAITIAIAIWIARVAGHASRSAVSP